MWFLKLDVLIFLCCPIFLNNFLDDMECLINADALLTLYNSDIEEIKLGIFLELVVKKGNHILDSMSQSMFYVV